MQNLLSLGLDIKKDELWYSVAEGTNRYDAKFLCIDVMYFQSESGTLMQDFNNIFLELISKYNPDIISYKLSADVYYPQIPYMHYSLGVLELLCQQHKVKTKACPSKWIFANHGEKLSQFRQLFNIPVNDEMLLASLIACFGLEA